MEPAEREIRVMIFLALTTSGVPMSATRIVAYCRGVLGDEKASVGKVIRQQLDRLLAAGVLRRVKTGWEIA